ncbi:MAG: beta-glucuronidase [Sphingobacteriaceae bacterium]|nr:beta-glucuronidase [Sphingobacteriaceae bacterium]
MQLLIILLLGFSGFKDKEIVSLHGTWKFEIDQDDKGVAGRWFSRDLSDQIKLPGSMAGNLKGDDITLKTKWTGTIYDSSFYFNPAMAKYREPGNIHIPFWLSPAKHYVGPAWYQKQVEIPSNWKKKRIILHLERAHTETRVWVGDKEIGMQNSLVAAHEYDLTPHLSPGQHRITVRVDNRVKEINVGPDSHSIADHTQGNWNGIIGKIALEATGRIYFDDIQVYPDLKNKKARVKMRLMNAGGSGKISGKVFLSAKCFNTDVKDETKTVTAKFSAKLGIAVIEVDLPFSDNMQTWDEFSPALYILTVKLDAKDSEITKEVQFGMREFKIEGNKFLINGNPVFLRGNLHNGEFPLTGYPATTVEAWERIYKVAKSHGLNHIRFHSWCPPEAAFIAADKVGVYLQPEGPSWPNHGPKIGLGQPIDKYLYDETNRIVKNYGNYASFTMLSAGNEPAGNQVKYLNEFVDYWKAKDSRRVYTGMSVGGSWPVVPKAEFQVRGGVRGLTWDKLPETQSDFSTGISKFTVPFVAHEMGQWCVYPNFEEINKYTGVYKPKNMELFRQHLKDQGMGDQAHDFLMASGRLQVLCYKNEIEKTLRTPGYAGFQLLGLQDFSGQGTALVGVLDAFWEEKGYVSPKEFSRFSNTTVPLARLPKFVFTNDEVFKAGIDLFHSGREPLINAVVKWVIKDTGGNSVLNGSFTAKTFQNGNGLPVGEVNLPLSEISIPTQLKLEVSVENTEFVNDWDFWVYPAKNKEIKSDFYYTTVLDDKAKSILNKGGKVFLNASGKVVKGKEVVMYFVPVFWNTSWFKMRPPHVTGMLIQYKSPAFADFPTSFHSDLQWWDIAIRSQVMILEDFPAGFKPLVQPIDTWFLNRRLALIYEAKVGKGKLVVSSADLREDTERKASKQLFYSLKKYMASDKFDPKGEVSFEVVNDVFVNPSKQSFKTYTNESPDELKPNSNQK